MALASGQANAVVYVGNWDPAFGADFPTLGWNGSAVFEIPEACLTANGGNGTYTNASPCASANGGLKMTSAHVNFYDLNTAAHLDGLDFTTPSLTITMEVTGGVLSGVTGLFLTPDTSSISLLGGTTYFWLGFVESNGDYFAQLLWKQYKSCPFFGTCIKDWGVSELNPDQGGSTFLTFRLFGSEVPEPGSLALLIPAVGMLAAFRRRRASA